MREKEASRARQRFLVSCRRVLACEVPLGHSGSPLSSPPFPLQPQAPGKTAFSSAWPQGPNGSQLPTGSRQLLPDLYQPCKGMSLPSQQGLSASSSKALEVTLQVRKQLHREEQSLPSPVDKGSGPFTSAETHRGSAQPAMGTQRPPSAPRQGNLPRAGGI